MAGSGGREAEAECAQLGAEMGRGYHYSATLSHFLKDLASGSRSQLLLSLVGERGWVWGRDLTSTLVGALLEV